MARTTEIAENYFGSADTYFNRMWASKGQEQQLESLIYGLGSLCFGLQCLAEAIRQVYDKLERIDRNMAVSR